MRARTFLILLAAAGVLATLYWVRFGAGTHSNDLKMGESLFVGFPVNDVAVVTIADSQNRVTLIKGETVWQVQERDGYPANFDELSDLVVKISRLKIGRSFSGSAESLARLDLIAPSASDAAAGGRRVTLTDAMGAVLADLILGQIRTTDAGGTAGQYLKQIGSPTVYLVDGNFRFLRADPAQWLKKQILDVTADEVAAVVVTEADSAEPVYSLARSQRGEPAHMTPVFPERSADPVKINQVLEALAPLTLDDVWAGEGPAPVETTGMMRLDYHLYDGRRISIFPVHDDQDRYTLRVAADESTLVAADPEPFEPATRDVAAQDDTDVAKTVEMFNAQYAPWVFAVHKWLFDSFITDPLQLLREAENG